jgi:protein-S-isoprenylcysteine O-methyltransferase Ste14
MQLHTELLRILLILGPTSVVVWLFIFRDYGERLWAGVLLSYAWQFQWRVLLYATGVSLGVWQFGYDDFAVYGVPMDLVFGMSALTGPVVILLLPRVPVFWIALLDILMVNTLLPIATPSLYAALLLSLVSLFTVVPGVLLGRWTLTDTHLYKRAGLQPVSWVLLLFWLFPSLFFQITGDSWAGLLQRPLWQNALLLLPMLLPAGLIASALYEFAVRGGGTGFPYDPPKRLVTTGIYRYLANPMQVGIVLGMGWWGLMLGSLPVSAAGMVAVMLFIVFKDVCNGSCRIGRTDPNWQHYQQRVPKWIPRRPG